MKIVNIIGRSTAQTGKGNKKENLYKLHKSKRNSKVFFGIALPLTPEFNRLRQTTFIFRKNIAQFAEKRTVFLISAPTVFFVTGIVGRINSQRHGDSDAVVTSKGGSVGGEKSVIG